MSRNTMNDSKNGREGSDSTIAASAVEQFSIIFRLTNRGTNLENVRRRWKTRNEFSLRYRNFGQQITID